MSKTITFIELSPPKQSLDSSGKQVIKASGFRCPTCNGVGGFDRTGYNLKWKDNPGDPDFKLCAQCEGRGGVVALVTIEWSPDLNTKKSDVPLKKE